MISPNSMVRKFCGMAQFLHSFGQIAQNYAETVHFPQNFQTMKLDEITMFLALNSL